MVIGSFLFVPLSHCSMVHLESSENRFMPRYAKHTKVAEDAGTGTDQVQ